MSIFLAFIAHANQGQVSQRIITSPAQTLDKNYVVNESLGKYGEVKLVSHMPFPGNLSRFGSLVQKTINNIQFQDVNNSPRIKFASNSIVDEQVCYLFLLRTIHTTQKETDIKKYLLPSWEVWSFQSTQQLQSIYYARKLKIK